ncbi:MAG: hypothetical protein ACX939_10605 [Hyphococcus sp.]
MTRTGSSKAAEPADANLRLQKARAFRQAACDGYELLDEGAIADPVVSNIVLSAIAYADALTVKYAGKINKQDHSAAPKLLRSALGNALPREQETRFRRILGQKDEAQYGTRSKRRDETELLLKDLERFAEFTEQLLIDM